MNAISGIAIGLVSPWPFWFISPFLWGVGWCYQKWCQEEHEEYAEAVKNRRLKWNLGPVAAHYMIEYVTAVSTSFFFAVVAGTIRNLFGLDPVGWT